MRKATSRNRRPLTKAQLLPIPAAELRRIQLKHHVALAALRDANDDVAQVATLLNAIYLAYFLDPAEPGPYRRAETALQDCADRAARGESSVLTDLERAAVEYVLAHLDAQLAAVPMHRYIAAFERLQRVTTADTVVSPIPAG
ncbi:hypothetical protein I5693_33230 [Burkholderia cenocepacia]|uniref:Fis family transcriptional regulator n=1 Tax=Burkholderia cenocepacia TaxID=95486 RepID=A0A427PKS3_9BURK|nr:hypothetical protein [Burkholderia cenocepacia]MBJ9672428.1 hypothetical protein [Burkholderia cenocepacia]MBJ9733915.1 hypothetical protein [Burkholderia cenocepacia]MBR8311310.1 hypothetical protein [Burkholderia cenocepacia]MBR8400215.1 hypothetical protein [Burkholderia cenocepacia]MCA7968140.1 hypothetical protein [Burkholderia cenocepacia]